MKYLILVLSIITGLFVSGCAGWAKIPTAGVYVTNNVENTTMFVESTRGEVLNPRIKTGDKAFVPVCGYPGGHQYTISAKVYAADGKYLGIAENPQYISSDPSGRYGGTWVVSTYNPTSVSYASQHAPPTVPPPIGSLRVMNNIKGVRVDLTSSEEPTITYKLLEGEIKQIPVGIEPKTDRFTLLARVYSLTGEYLGHTDYGDSIDSRGYGDDRVWSIASYTPVRSISKR